MRAIGLGFEVIHPSSDETVSDGEAPEQFALRVSLEKACSVSSALGDGAIVIGADTIVVVDGEILGKPGDPEEASSMLRKLSGKEHSVYTAFSIVRAKNELLHGESVCTVVRVKPLAASEIEGYIKTGEPMDKAGAYAIQGAGSFIVSGIEFMRKIIEKLCHREIGFAMTIIHGGIDQAWRANRVYNNISLPEITV